MIWVQYEHPEDCCKVLYAWQRSSNVHLLQMPIVDPHQVNQYQLLQIDLTVVNAIIPLENTMLKVLLHYQLTFYVMKTNKNMVIAFHQIINHQQKVT